MGYLTNYIKNMEEDMNHLRIKSVISDIVYEWHCDAGHAWLAVPIHHLEELNIVNKISTFSYMKDGIAYLEEDRDAGLFIKSFFKKYGGKPQIKEDTSGVNENIRNLETYHWSNIIQERAGLI